MTKIKVPKKVVHYIDEQIEFYGLDQLTGSKDIRLAVATSKGIKDISQEVVDWINETPHSYKIMRLVIASRQAKRQHSKKTIVQSVQL